MSAARRTTGRAGEASASRRRSPAARQPAPPRETGPSRLAAAAGVALDLAARAARSPGVQRAVALALLGAGVATASSAVRARVEASPRWQLDRAGLSLAPLPGSLSERAREDLRRLPLPARPSAFDPALVPVTAACLAALPWVRDVERVALDAGGRLEFTLLAHVPVARLDGDQALTGGGAVIPLRYAADADALPRVVGLPPDGPDRARALTAAVGVLDELGDLRARVRTVDLSNHEGRADPRVSEVLLTLDGGLLVEWGRAPDPPGGGAGAPLDRADDGPGRPRLEPEARRRALRAFLQGGVDLSTVERVAVRWDEVVYALKPAATPPPPTARPSGAPAPPAQVATRR